MNNLPIRKMMAEKSSTKIIQKLLLMCYMLKEKSYIKPLLQNITQSMKNKLLS